jgi:PAS domain S-box-containing protein
MGKRFLEHDSDLRVQTTQSSVDALQMLSTMSYDAVIAEYEMPADNSILMFRSVREKFPKLPFIFFTHKNREEFLAEAFKNGVDHYVKKGTDQTSQFTELSHALKNAVEFRQNEQKIALLNRIDALHRRINESVVHIHDRRQLAQEVCRIMIQEGGFVLAWIGFEDPVTARIDTIFASGEIDEFFGKVRLLSEDISQGHGPTATTIKKGKYTICNDIQAFPDLLMWEDDAVRKGYRSAAAFPLSTGKTTHGAITLYSSERNFFTETEIRLLSGISEEISYVLKTMEMLDNSRQVQGDLELSEHRLREAIDFLPLATFATDTSGSVIIWNKAMEKLTAASAEQVTARGDYEYSFRILGERVPGLLDLIFASDTEIEKYRYSALQRTRGCVKAQIYVPELRGKPATLEAVASLLYDQNGQLSGAIETIAETGNIHLKDEKYHHLFQTAEHGLLILDPDSKKILDANSWINELTGYSREYLIGKKIEDAGFFKDSTGADQFFNELKKSDHVRYGDILLVTKYGTPIDVEFFSKVTSFDDRRIIQCSVYDISKRKRSETAQKIARKNLDMFSSRIRHDILNQLMIVSGSLELASYSIQDPDLQKHLNRAQTATKTIQKQILFTREFEDLGAEVPTWQIVPTAIHHAFLDIETDSITLNVQQDDFEVFADPLFEKVFYLLFDFAHRFGEKVTRIDISYAITPEELIIIVSDNGIGIVPETKDQLFAWRPGNDKSAGLHLAQKILSGTGLSIRETGEFRKGARFEIIVPKEAFRSGSSR